MSALGRILQIIGWLWIAAGFFGPLVNVPGISVFPGIIILFISRVVRRQSEQVPRSEDNVEQATEQQETPRILNTERRPRPAPEVEPKPAPEPKLALEPKQETEPIWRIEPKHSTEPNQRIEPEPVESERGELLERVLLAGQEMAEQSEEPPRPELVTDEDGRPLSSAEMIARAHRRWDRRP